jgi:hypothetical protein
MGKENFGLAVVEDEILPVQAATPSTSSSITLNNGLQPALCPSAVAVHHTHHNQLALPRPAFISRNSSTSVLGWDDKPPAYPYGTPASGSTISLPQSSHESLPLRTGAPKRDRRGAALRVLSSLKRKIFSHVDPKTIWDLIDIREVFWPFTWKKYIILFIVFSLAAGVAVSNRYTGWVKKSMEITRSNMLPVLIIVIGLEPIMIIVILLVARVPPLHTAVGPPVEKAAPDVELDVEKAIHIVEVTRDHSTALVIPCHNSDHEATSKVLKSASDPRISSSLTMGVLGILFRRSFATLFEASIPISTTYGRPSAARTLHSSSVLWLQRTTSGS